MSARSNSARIGAKPRGIAPGRSAEHAGIWAGTVAAADEIGGRYCEDCHIAKSVEDAGNHGGVKSYATDPKRAEMLWAMSERLVGEKF